MHEQRNERFVCVSNCDYLQRVKRFNTEKIKKRRRNLGNLNEFLKLTEENHMKIRTEKES